MFRRTGTPAVEVKAYIKANKRSLVRKCAGLYLFQGSIARVKTVNDFGATPEVRSIAGVTARVENATSFVPNPPLADLWIVIDGPDFQWHVKIRAGSPILARKFVEATNTVSRNYVPPRS